VLLNDKKESKQKKEDKMHRIKYHLLIINLLLILIYAFCSAATIESISISTINDTTLLVFEVDTNAKVTTNRISNSNLKLTINAKSAINNVKSKGIIRKFSIDSDSTKTTFNLNFNQPYDFRKQNEIGTVIFKFYPILTREIKTVVLDPGHGGIDPGAIGKKKLQEKEVNLAIAKILKKKLENYGLKVSMSRSDDRFVALSERSRFANGKKTDLFISIHCNSSVTNKKACGFETFFLSEAKTDWERAVLARENGALKFDPEVDDTIVKGELSLILADLTQNEFLKESYNLALAIQTAAIMTLKDVDRGVKQAGFYVLRGTFTPSVLVECGFVSNVAEERLLTSGRYRENVAQAIFIGVINYIKDYEERTKF
jgi:N-acetylmuramoyl-L-alanine amidase